MNGEQMAATENLGVLYGVGVGPGDPGLVTLRAVDVIRRSTTVAYPVQREGAASRALETVRQHLDASSRLLPLVMPMTRDKERLGAAHAAAVQALVEAASDGNDVACLALGDPLFYSTFGYLAERFPGRVEVVSGVSAMSAMAAAVGRPLAAGDMPTVVVTGFDHEALEAALGMNASIVIIKPRSLSAQSLDLMEKAGAWDRSRAALELGSPEERIIQRLDRRSIGDLPYFSVVWINPTRTGDI